ncbi:MAG: outer membrane beta-barrel protein [Flavobacteriales bacterium]|nr:outer membrane beta-barrel protein [Flavobacteriales bacterium]
MRQLLTLLACLFLAAASRGQVSELGPTGGVSYYIGDLNPLKHYPKNTHFAGGLVFRYNFNDRYAFRLQGLYSKLEAYDSDSPDSLQLLRNLSFRTNLLEISGLIEVNFFKYRSKGKDSRKWTPFVFVGFGYFRTNPQAQLDDTWYDLQPLGTEGQGTSSGEDYYKLDQLCMPFGTGLKFNFGKVDLQLEWGLRRTWTDHIDDVSGQYVDNAQLEFESGDLAAQLADRSVLRETGFNTGRARGDVQTRDWYQYTGLTLTFLLTRFTECDELYMNMGRRR